MVIVLSIGPKVRWFIPGRERWNFQGDKICSTTFFGGEVKLPAPCKILRHVKDSLKYDRDTDRQNSAAISRPVCPRVATRCLLQPEQITLLDESGKIGTQMGSTIDQKMVAVAWDALYNTSL
jgi:hypothetical protein